MSNNNNAQETSSETTFLDTLLETSPETSPQETSSEASPETSPEDALQEDVTNPWEDAAAHAALQEANRAKVSKVTTTFGPDFSGWALTPTSLVQVGRRKGSAGLKTKRATALVFRQYVNGSPTGHMFSPLQEMPAFNLNAASPDKMGFGKWCGTVKTSPVTFSMHSPGGASGDLSADIEEMKAALKGSTQVVPVNPIYASLLNRCREVLWSLLQNDGDLTDNNGLEWDLLDADIAEVLGGTVGLLNPAEELEKLEASRSAVAKLEAQLAAARAALAGAQNAAQEKGLLG